MTDIIMVVEAANRHRTNNHRGKEIMIVVDHLQAM
jgi:hypothetical protein